MTMQLWELPVAVAPWRLVVLTAATVLLTVGLTRSFGAASGSSRWASAVVDAGVAIVAGGLVSVTFLTLLDVVDPVGSWQVAVSVVTVAGLSASLGAAFARGQLGQSSPKSRDSGYHHELFLMLAGAVVFSANVAPTPEIELLAALMEPAKAILLMVVSLVLIHALVYGSDFAGQEEGGPARAFYRFSLPGYAIALGASAFMLWTSGRFEGTGALVAATESVVLSLPACLGAGAARLVL